MPATWGSGWSSESDVGSRRDEKAFSTRTYRCSGATCAPLADTRLRNCSCAPLAAAVHRRISVSVARPPSARTREASEAARRTTTSRGAVETPGRTPRTPCQPASSPEASGGLEAGAPAPARSSPPAAAQTTAAVALRKRGIGVQTKVLRRGEPHPVAGGGPDHRRVVRAQVERREAGFRQGLPQSRVRGHAAHDRDPLEARLLRGSARASGERADDCLLVRRGQIGSALLGLVGPELTNGVQESGLEPGE